MKLGFIVECGDEGAEVKVCDRLARVINPNVEIRYPFVTNVNKPDMIRRCGEQASVLLKECDRVIIVCDLDTSRHRKQLSKCSWQMAMERDIALIRSSLQNFGADVARVRLLIIREELEAWLVADHQAVAAFLSTKEHKCTLKAVKSPEGEVNPKLKLTQMFQGYKPCYRDLDHAHLIAAKMNDPNRLRRVCSFVRFQKLVSEVEHICPRVTS